MSDLSVPVPGLEQAIDRRNAQLAEMAADARALKPLVPAWLVSLAAVLVPIFSGGFAFLPHPYSVVSAVLAFVAAGLAGIALPQFKFTKPVIPLALVPSALTLGGLLGTFATSVEAPLWKGGLGFLSALCFALAGKALPQPVK